MEKEILQNSNIAIRKIRTPYLVFLSIITLGIFWYVWLWKLITDVNRLYPKKYIHRRYWFTVLIFVELLSIYFEIHHIQTQFIIKIPDIAWQICHLALALQILKNIEYYIRDEFDINIQHNIFGWLFFGCFYINYRINRLAKYIRRELKWKIRQLKREQACL